MPKRPRYRGSIWKLFGLIQIVLAYLTGFVAFLFVVEPIKSGSVSSITIVSYLVVGVLLSLVVHSGRKCYLKGKRIVAATRPFPSIQGSRRPIVYLRSFKDDIVAANPMGDGPPGTEFHYISFVTEEEQLAAVMNEIGPFAAIGRPGEELPDLGANRIYVQQHEEWQQEVINLISIAQLVVIRLGMTEGIVWELSTAIKHVKPERLLLLVPWGKSQYEAFCKTYATLFPAGLPEFPWFLTRAPIGSIDGIVYFEPDWTPHFLRLKLSRRYSGTTPLKASLKIALTPVVNRLGLRFKPLTVPWVVKIPAFIVGIPIIIGLLLLLLIIIGFLLYEILSSLVAILLQQS
jgi:hypothetical protein